MFGKIQMSRARRRAPFSAILGCAAAAAALLAAPAVASACASLAKERSFVGTVSMSFSGSASGSNASSGGTLTVSLDRTASDLRLEVGKVGSSAFSTAFEGDVTGGTISVNDQYADSGGTTGQQTASGPTGRDFAELVQLPISGGPNGKIPIGMSCDYQVFVAWGIHTTPSGSWPNPPDTGAGATAHTPATSIPASLDLSGSATVPAYFNDQNGPNNEGWYAFGNSGSFEQTFDELKACGTVYGSCGPSGQPDGTATISWHLFPNKLKCVVPKLKGKTLAQAKNALAAAGCKLGKVTSKTSFTTPKDRVLSSSPGAGKNLKLGAKVDLTISGPPCVVPNLVGDFLYQAKPALTSANCTLGKVTKKYSVTVAKGKIISNSPKAGSKLYFGSPVAITVSLGPPYCNVPKFLPGRSLFQAKALLSNPNNFCTVGNITFQSSTTFAKGTVITSHPKPGTNKLPAYSIVGLTLSNGP